MADHEQGGDQAQHAEHAETTDQGLPLLDDPPSNTPLDLLLNAISGSAGYTFPEHEAGGEGEGDGENPGGAAEGDAAISALLGAEGGMAHEDGHEHAYEDNAKRDGNGDGTQSPRQAKIARTLNDHFSGVRRDAFSTVEVWHPKTGQKSYGKERR